MRALVFGSGGSRIAYHVGVANRLLDAGKRFDIYAGNSAGAIVAAMLAQHGDGKELAAVKSLGALLELRTEDVWEHWYPLGRLGGLWKLGLLDSAPLRRLVHKHLDQTRLLRSGKKLLVGAVSARTGRACTFTEELPCIVEAVLASAAIPGVFCPVPFSQDLWWDGAVRDVAPLRAAICAGATEVVVSLLTPLVQAPRGDLENVGDALMRAADIAAAEILEGDLLATELYTRLAEKGLSTKRKIRVIVVRPDTEILGLEQSSLEFDPANARRMRERGYQDAFTAVG